MANDINFTFPAPTVGDGVTLLHNQNDYTDFTSDYVTNLVVNSQTIIKFALQLDDSSSLSENIQFSWNNISFKEVIEVPQEYKDEVQGLIYTLNTDGTAWTVKGDCYTELVTNSDITRAPSGGSTSFTFVNNVKNSNIVIADSLFDIPVTTIADSAFGSQDAQVGCTNITSVKIPNTVTMIGVEAFFGCTGLTGTLTIPDNVTKIGMLAFFNCSGLMSVVFKGTNPPYSLVNGFGMANENGNTHNIQSIYVPSAAVDAYKTAVSYSNWQSKVKPLS